MTVAPVMTDFIYIYILVTKTTIRIHGKELGKTYLSHCNFFKKVQFNTKEVKAMKKYIINLSVG